MKLSEIIARIEKRIPKSWAESWDNPGLAVGDPGAEIDGIALSLDATADTASAASAMGWLYFGTYCSALRCPSLWCRLFSRSSSSAVSAASGPS